MNNDKVNIGMALVVSSTIVAGCGAQGYANVAADPNSSAHHNAEITLQESSSACRAGEAQPNARDVPWDDLLSSPQSYDGALVRLRGVPWLDYESWLQEPVVGGRAIMLSVRKLGLRPEDLDNVLACEAEIVLVEGEIVRINARGGERIVLEVKHIRGPAE